jgi:hypothetical protein
VPHRKVVNFGNEVEVMFYDAGHILGSSIIRAKVRQNGQERIILFSGNIGRPHRPIVCDPTVFDKADYVLIESTYGDRGHEDAEDIKSGFEDPRRYKLHSFRHHFASLCANHNVAYRKALAWLGHSSSQMLDLYYHLHDEDSQQAIMALARTDGTLASDSAEPSTLKGNLRAIGQSKIEKTLQVPEVQELVGCLSDITERAGFEPAVGKTLHGLSKTAR